MKQEIGTLLHIYSDEFEATKYNQKEVNKYKKQIKQSGRNWVPVVVIQTGGHKFRIVTGGDIAQACKELGIKKIWCIIADETAENWNEATKTEESANEPATAKTVTPEPDLNPIELSYRELQGILKQYKKEGYKVPALNSKRAVLERALVNVLEPIPSSPHVSFLAI